MLALTVALPLPVIAPAATITAWSGYGVMIAIGIILAVAGLLALLSALRIHSTNLPQFEGGLASN